MLGRFSPSEVVGLLLALGGALFLLAERRRLLPDPRARLPIAAFGVLLTGWVLTILEEFAAPAALNFAEHLCYAVGTGILALWCWLETRRTPEERDR